MFPSSSGVSHIAARRLHPSERTVVIPPGEEALLVRDGEAHHTLPSGTHRVRGLFQSSPELYVFTSGQQFLNLWITALASGDGEPVNLSWRLIVHTTDAAQAWRAWWSQQRADGIPLPGEQISAHAADATQELIRRYTLSDLRADVDTRRHFAGKLSLLLKDELAAFGMEIAATPDPQALRVLNESDLAKAEIERQELLRLLEDERLKTEINRIFNAEALAQRMRESAAERGIPLEPEAAMAAAASVMGSPGTSATTILEQVIPEPAPTPAPVKLAPPVQTPMHHVFRRLSILILVASLVAALALGAIALLRPEMLDGTTQRNQVISGIIGLAMLGVLMSWVIDQIIRRQAYLTATRLLAEEDMESPEDHIGRLEIRHLLLLIGAMLGVGVAAAAFWSPENVVWLRVVSAAVGILSAGFAIRIDWLYSVNSANNTVANAQRRVAGARIAAARPRTIHARLQKSLTAELEITSRRLGDAIPLTYSALHDRELYRTLQGLQARVDELLPKAAALPLAAGDDEEARADITERAAQLEEFAAACSSAMEQLSTALGNRDSITARSVANSLGQTLSALNDRLDRWQVVAAATA